ncbi:MAG: serine hydrolase domain-containing protein [Bacteroidales bacterium]
MKKRLSYIALSVFLAGLIWGCIYLNSLLPIITGYPAKYLCSAVFVSNRQPAEVESSELNFSLIRFASNQVNYREKSVTSRFLWGKSKAIYREGFGCTLLRDPEESMLKTKSFPQSQGISYSQNSTPWPLGNLMPEVPSGIDKQKLSAVSDRLITRDGYQGKAFAFVVVYKGCVVAEQYRHGFSANTRLLSWSMAKSFTNALAGIMVLDGLLDIHKKDILPAWSDDRRKEITVSDLMQMQSGLRWNEDYGNSSDVTLMLYRERDYAGFAYNQLQEFPAGQHWYYSSGSTNIVNYVMRRQFRSDSAYQTFSKERLFNKIGMPDAVFESDPSGTQVGSSYLYATARDFARFGLLYLHDGVFNGERILPEGWVKYSTTPASQSKGSYGAFFWLNQRKRYPQAPPDMYYCNGHDGQRIFIIPSKELVVVILGYSPKPDHEMDFNRLLKDILAGLPG